MSSWTEDRPTMNDDNQTPTAFGIAHLTTVPANYDPETGEVQD